MPDRSGPTDRHHAAPRQHDAMEYTEPTVDIDKVRRYRLGRLREEMVRQDCAGLLLFDQINTRYATDATNMQVWCSHYETRCVFVAAEGSSANNWPIPDEYHRARYPSMIHGVGLGDENASIKYWPDFADDGYDGVLAPGMTLCVESFIATRAEREGVKLEEQVLITETGCETLSGYPFEEEWL